MGSLKAFAPVLAAQLGVTADVVYERQRKLARTGIFPEPEHGGRDTGLMATSQTVAAMLIAFLATDRLADVTSAVKRLSGLRYSASHSDECPFTGAKTFKAALVAILDNEDFARATRSVSVSRQKMVASIFYYSDARRTRSDNSTFGTPKVIAPSFEVEATLSDEAILQIAMQLKQEQES